MKALVTGATGFLGSRLVDRLLDRGDVVVGLARSPSSAQKLIDRGCKFVQGDLAQDPAVRAAVQGCDAVFHAAGVHKIGIRRSEVAAMEAANVDGTQRILDAAIEEGVGRIVHLSGISVFGNTRGQVVDETFTRTDLRFLSHYDRTKYRAHALARERIDAGGPVIIVQPGAVYGPGDHSAVGHQLAGAAAGRLPFQVFPSLGLVLAHVDDVTEGILQAHDRGRIGEAYVLGGETTTLGQAIERAARAGRVAPPRRTLPRGLLRMGAPLGGLLSRISSIPPNLAELSRACDGVTYWASDEKARSGIGYSRRDLQAGLADLLSSSATRQG